jgi:arylsulfatase A-like enzyme
MKFRILAAALTALLVAPDAPAVAAAKTPPNVLLIVLDDQNAFAGRTDLAPAPVSPNLNRLAARGVTFANAQCAAPVCNPSRTAFLSGLRPSTTGIYDNSQDSTPAGHILTRTKALPTYFHDHGYLAAGGGKIFGSSFGSVVKGRVWDESPERKKRGAYKHDPRPKNAPVQGLGKHDWAPSPVPRDQLEDWRLAGWAAEFLAKPRSKPFFLAVGIVSLTRRGTYPRSTSTCSRPRRSSFRT